MREVKVCKWCSKSGNTKYRMAKSRAKTCTSPVSSSSVLPRRLALSLTDFHFAGTLRGELTAEIPEGKKTLSNTKTLSTAFFVPLRAQIQFASDSAESASRSRLFIFRPVLAARRLLRSTVALFRRRQDRNGYRAACLKRHFLRVFNCHYTGLH